MKRFLVILLLVLSICMLVGCEATKSEPQNEQHMQSDISEVSTSGEVGEQYEELQFVLAGTPIKLGRTKLSELITKLEFLWGYSEPHIYSQCNLEYKLKDEFVFDKVINEEQEGGVDGVFIRMTVTNPHINKPSLVEDGVITSISIYPNGYQFDLTVQDNSVNILTSGKDFCMQIDSESVSSAFATYNTKDIRLTVRDNKEIKAEETDVCLTSIWYEASAFLNPRFVYLLNNEEEFDIGRASEFTSVRTNQVRIGYNVYDLPTSFSNILNNESIIVENVYTISDEYDYMVQEDDVFYIKDGISCIAQMDYVADTTQTFPFMLILENRNGCNVELGDCTVVGVSWGGDIMWQVAKPESQVLEIPFGVDVFTDFDAIMSTIPYKYDYIEEDLDGNSVLSYVFNDGSNYLQVYSYCKGSSSYNAQYTLYCDDASKSIDLTELESESRN